MINLLTIIGARPQIIKVAAFSRAVALHNAARPESTVQELILHTGQHYDNNMSKEAFFLETPCIILRDETEWVEIKRQVPKAVRRGKCR